MPRPTARLLAALPVALLAVLAGPPPPAGATPVSGSEVAVVPADGVLHLEGHGWGHAQGLSQWSAQGAAISGLPAAAILDAAYPGTQQAVAPARTLRVQLSAAGTGATVVWAAAGLAASSAGGAPAALPTGPAYQRWRATAAAGSTIVASWDGTAWTDYGAPLASPVAFSDSAAVLRVATGGGSTSYRGTVSAVTAGGVQVAIDTVPMEDYLRGVVPVESPPSWRPAALQAQAVAARSYASYAADHVAPGSPSDICDSSACQAYGGVAAETSSTDAAVAATAGTVRTYKGAAIFATFSASNGGWSLPGSLPYLVAAADPYDGVDPANPQHSWTATLPATVVETRWPQLGRLVSLEVTGRDGNGDWGGRVSTVVLHGVGNDGAPTLVTTSGATIAALRSWPAATDGLRSPWWHVVGATSIGPANGGAPAPAPVPAPAAPTPPRTGLVTVPPLLLLDTGRSPVAAAAPRALAVAGRGTIPTGATAALVTVVAAPGARAARLDAWADGGRRAAAVGVAPILRGLPSGGSALVPLGAGGRLDVAPTSGSIGLRLTVTAYAVPGGTSGLVPATATDRPAWTGIVPAGASRALSLPARPGPPAGATAALLAVTTSAGPAPAGARGTVSVAGVPMASVSAGQAPQATSTVLAPLTALTTGRPVVVTGLRAHVRVDVVGWLAPGGATVVPPAPVTVSSGPVPAHGGVVRATGGPAPATTAAGASTAVPSTAVPSTATSVTALVTLTAPAPAPAPAPAGPSAGPGTPAPTALLSGHGLAPAQAGAGRVALLPGAPVTVLVVLPLRDGRFVVRPSGVRAPVAVSVSVLGWTPAP